MTTSPFATRLPNIKRSNARCALAVLSFVGLQPLTSNRASGQTTWYVNAHASGAQSGTNWASAFADLQDALDIAFWGEEVWVAAGIYLPDRQTGDRNKTFVIPDGVRVYGGFSGTETRVDQRQPRTFVTTLCGDLNGDDGLNFTNRDDNSYHVLRVTNAGIETVLDGFTVTAGNADGFDSLGNGSGGGMFSAGGLTIRNAIFVDNSARLHGGGLYNLDGSPIVSDCAFIANRAGIGGGLVVFGTGFARGLSVAHGTPLLTRCTFTKNHSTQSAGAMYTTGVAENPILNLCSFIANSTDGFGGAMVNDGGNHTLTSCLFDANTAVGRAGAIANSTLTTLNACTVVGNVASEGGGIQSDFFLPTVTSSIVWGNRDKNGNGQSSQIAGPSPIINRSCVQGWDGSWGGTGNFGVDPLFANPDGLDAQLGTADDNFRLTSESPCINTGQLVPGLTDLDGHARALCGNVDMGAYEFGIGDIDCNGLVDLADYAEWDRCLTPSQGAPLGQGCKSFDFNADQDVDLIDFAGFQTAAATQPP